MDTTTYAPLNNDQLLILLAEELIRIDIVEMLHEAERNAHDIDEREAYMVARVRIDGVLATYHERFGTVVVIRDEREVQDG